MAKILRRGRAVRCVCAALMMWLGGSVALRADEPMEKKIEALRVEIARHDELYFKKAAPEISDAAYDALKRELLELERRAGVEAASETVGDDRDGRRATAAHGVRMMSLAKVYSDAELRAFLKRSGDVAGGSESGWVIEPKYDGLAVSAVYESGRLVRVVTRGDGFEGDDVTANAGAVKGLERVLQGEDWPERIEVRGEVLVTFEEFARVNAEREAAGESLFANPRALAAGSLKLDDLAEAARRGMSVVFYGWGEVAPAEKVPGRQSEFHERMKAWGLPGVENPRRARTEDEVMRCVRVFGKERAGLAYPTDGVVIKVDEVAAQARIGTTEHAPKWAVAYKFSAERVATRVRGITVQVGRTGALTPVAELEPVKIGGSTVTRVTLHNAEEIARLGVRVGDVVWIEKAGEIIPAVTGVDVSRRASGSVAYVFPVDCPVCGAAVSESEDGGVRQFCPNRACEGQVIARLRHFAGAQGVAIRGLGEETIAAVVRNGRVRVPGDFYRMTREDWRAVPGVGAKTAEKLCAAVDASRSAELWRVVNGLGIPGVGVASSRILAKRFGTLEALVAATEVELVAVPGVGAAQAKAVRAFFGEPGNRRMVEEVARELRLREGRNPKAE